MNFGIYSNDKKKKTDDSYLAIDKQGRVYLNANAQKLFGIEKGKSVDVQLGYVDGTIYMIKADSEHADKEAKPFRFSGERAYASAKSLIEALNITPSGEAKSEKYFLDESFNTEEYEGVFAFKHEALIEAEKKAAEEAAAANEAAKTDKPKNTRKNTSTNKTA
jgi:hypothetical protein